MEFKMNKVPFLTALALVVGTSAAFAANTELLKPDFARTETCSDLSQRYPATPAMTYSGGKQLARIQNADSYCRTNADNNDKFADRAEAHANQHAIGRHR
jgi:hypothetical protein